MRCDCVMAYSDREDLNLPPTKTFSAQISRWQVGGRIADVEITAVEAVESVNGATGLVLRQLVHMGDN